MRLPPAAHSLLQPRQDNEPSAPAPADGPTPAAVHGERPAFRLDLMRSLQMHRKLAMGIALAGLALAAASAVSMWPVYIAKSQIYVQPVSSGVMEQGYQIRWPYDANTYDSFVQQQVQSATNPEVLVSALHKMRPGTWQKSGESEPSAARRLGTSIEVARIGTSYEVQITACANRPEIAAQIANAVARSVMERASGEANAGNTERLTILKEERDRVQKELDSDRSEQETLNKQLGMAAVGATPPDLIDNDIEKTREELIRARTEHDEAEAKFQALGAGQASSKALDAQADEMIASDPGLTSMKTSLNQRRAQLITQMSNLTPSNPAYKQDADELAQIDNNLNNMMSDLRARAAARIQQQLRSDLERTAGVEAQLNGQLRQLAGTAAGATPRLQRANDLAADIVRLQARYANVDEQVRNLMLQNSVPGAVHLSVPAAAPTHPSYSGILKKAFPIAMAGILLGLLAAMIVNNLDPRVYIAADVERVLGVAPMAVLPDLNEVSEAAADEHFLRIAASLEQDCEQGTLRSCMFTGTGHGAGATMVSARVKNMLASMGRIAALVHAGAASSESGNWDGSNQVAAPTGRSISLLQTVTEQSRAREGNLVLTDAAPLGISAETEFMARFVDCTIVVIESGVTTRTQLRSAADTLERLNARTVGFVLNRVKLANADPAYRRAIQEAEDHLQSRGRMYIPQPARSLQESTAAEPASDTAKADLPAPKEPEVKATTGSVPRPVEPETGGRAAQIAAAEEAPATPLSTPRAVAPETEAEQIQPRMQEPLPPPSATVCAKETDAAPAEIPDDMPWWLSDAGTRKPASGAAEARQTVQEQHDRAPARSVVGMPASSYGERPLFSFIEKQKPAPEQTAMRSGSRLSGLRGLLFSHGLKNLHQSRETSSRDRPPAEQESPAVKLQEQPPHPKLEPAGPVQTCVPTASEVPQPAAPIVTVEAVPEFLPPKPQTYIFDRERTRKVREQAGKDSRSAYDDLEILPAKRGQYRK